MAYVIWETDNSEGERDDAYTTLVEGEQNGSFALPETAPEFRVQNPMT